MVPPEPVDIEAPLPLEDELDALLLLAAELDDDDELGLAADDDEFELVFGDELSLPQPAATTAARPSLESGRRGQTQLIPIW